MHCDRVRGGKKEKKKTLGVVVVLVGKAEQIENDMIQGPERFQVSEVRWGSALLSGVVPRRDGV